MTEKQQSDLQSKIREDLEVVTKDIKELELMTKPISPECSLGDLARFELMNDQVVYEQRLRESLIRQNKLNYALERIRHSDSLLCIECGDEIAFERLLAMPEATHCIECASLKQ